MIIESDDEFDMIDSKDTDEKLTYLRGELKVPVLPIQSLKPYFRKEPKLAYKTYHRRCKSEFLYPKMVKHTAQNKIPPSTLNSFD